MPREAENQISTRLKHQTRKLSAYQLKEAISEKQSIIIIVKRNKSDNCPGTVSIG